MKLVSWNVNGIRAVHGKGFAKWLKHEDADVVCLQEVKAKPEQLEEEIHSPPGYRSLWHPAEKAGYSGVTVFTRQEPLSVQEGFGFPEFDREGRVLVVEMKNFILLNTYFPNSQRDHARLDYKLAFCEKILTFMNRLRKKGKSIVICGDFNIAHKEIDLKNPKQNMKNAGFLPEERAWMDTFVSEKYIDTFRVFNQEPGHYTWWSYRPGIRARNIGWRLDHFFVSEDLKDRLKSASHRTEVLGSDHCPVVLELKR